MGLRDEAAVELGTRIRRARRVHGWTQQRLSEEAGVSRDSILRLEKGHRNTRPSTISKVGKALGLEYRDLMAGPEPTPIGAPPAGVEDGGSEFAERELLTLAQQQARAEGISEDEALGRLFRQHMLVERTRPRRRFGLPREERPVMSSPEASTEALSVVSGS